MPPDLDPTGNFFVGFPVLPPMPTPDAWCPAPPVFLRFIEPADLHLTAAFFGRLTAERVISVSQALTTLATTPPARLQTGRLLLLPSARQPSVACLAIADGGDALANLTELLRVPLCLAAGVTPDKRPALPHLTLARLPRRVSRTELDDLKRWAATAVAPALPLRLAPACLFGRSLRHPQPRYVRFPS